MKLLSKGAVLTGAGALLLGASLALSSWDAVSGASQSRSTLSAAKPQAAFHRVAPDKKCSGSTACLTENNTGSGSAILGMSLSGTTIEANATTGTALYGSSTGTNSATVGTNSSSGTGVYGYSKSGYGINGQSHANIAIEGYSAESDGVYGQSGGGSSGVYGYSSAGAGGAFESDSYSPALYAQNDGEYGPSLLVENSVSVGHGSFEVDYAGDGIFHGWVKATGYYTDQRAHGGTQVEAFSPESTRATIEDTGTARLMNGEGAVRFDSAFAGTIDAARGYQVLLTPNGETRGWLYVAAKYEGGFIVREAEQGRSSIYFDYRVVAHPYGASDARLPQLNITQPPIPHLPRHFQPQQP
jgi:hypothetical protein